MLYEEGQLTEIQAQQIIGEKMVARINFLNNWMNKNGYCVMLHSTYKDRVSGIISEEVGEANNASVLAVALDIPVIVAAAGATKVLKSGTTITMDAKRGLVYSGMEEIN